jgi:NAD(P)-dependent dehydrogenase (short-subunit alcohol dehydrogenase family)
VGRERRPDQAAPAHQRNSKDDGSGATFPQEKVEKFGQQVPMGRAAQPDEIAPSYVFFAAPQLSSYYSGEVLAPIGGETLPG